ncbi:MAG: peptidylprolyl isomerase [Patescibacteria group bacterium]
MNNKSVIYLIAIISVLAGAWYLIFKSDLLVPRSGDEAGIAPEEKIEKMEQNTIVKINTNFGAITIKLFDGDAPKTTANFLKLAKENFYDKTKFHRVIKGFMIQGGDPLSKDAAAQNRWGTGGPGYAFEDEINAHKIVRGVLAMANSGPNTNGSQFFIVTAQSTPWLDGKHTAFGEVIEGIDVVDKIESLKTGENDRPLEDAIIEKIEIEK